MLRKFALSSIITGGVMIISILSYRLFIGLCKGWDVFMVLNPVFFYILLIIAGNYLLKNRNEAVHLYRLFSWGIIIERSLFMYLMNDIVEIMLMDYVPLICALPFIIMYPRKFNGGVNDYMERKFAWSSIVMGIMLISGIIFIRLTIDLYTGWNVYMMLGLLFFYSLLSGAGISLLLKRKYAILLYKLFSRGIIIERFLLMIFLYKYVDIVQVVCIPIVCILPFIIMCPRK
ncbi:MULTISPECIES: hypothetical protein [Butyricimonas]|uniref:hypothetical protein n=1 Tax=Butyricimonas TaxID=574697 RepID=UPI0007FB23C1|nr:MULTISPECIES: hypothetical protein [Butyricimonas]